MRFLHDELNGRRHRRPNKPVGFTLLELVTVVALLGLVLAKAFPTASALRDRMAVSAAREHSVGFFHRARLEAVAHGGAGIRLTASPAGLVLWSGGVLRESGDLAGRFGVEMTLSGGRDEAEIRYDALGLGRVASQTIRIRRNRAESLLVVSSLGRVTRR